MLSANVTQAHIYDRQPLLHSPAAAADGGSAAAVAGLLLLTHHYFVSCLNLLSPALFFVVES
jgi:hypothetical protein